MKSMKVFKYLYVGLIGILVLAMVGCSFFDDENNSVTGPAGDVSALSNATYGAEDARFGYQAGSNPGIELTADFNRYHKTGQPYGDWVANVIWRDGDGKTIADVTVRFRIDGSGKGTADVPPSFLNEVFRICHERYMANNNDVSLWHGRPGLRVNVLPESGAVQYYDITGEFHNWSFGGSLEDLVNHLQLGWWPGLPQLTALAVAVNLGDPFNVHVQAPPAASVSPCVTPTCVTFTGTVGCTTGSLMGYDVSATGISFYGPASPVLASARGYNFCPTPVNIRITTDLASQDFPNVAAAFGFTTGVLCTGGTDVTVCTY